MARKAKELPPDTEDVEGAEAAPPKKGEKKKSPKPAANSGLRGFAENEKSGISVNWLGQLSSMLSTSSYKYSTGSIELDIALRGGWPKSQNSCVFGPEGAGKTHLMCKLAKTAYDTCRKCHTQIIDFHDYETGEVETTCKCHKKLHSRVIYALGERRVDPAYYIKAHNLPADDKDHFYLGFPETGDFLADAIERAAEQKALELLIVDSFASLLAEQQQGRRASNQMMGSHARMIQNLVFTLLAENQKNGPDQEHDITLAGTNQVRASMQSYGSPYKTPGGYAYEHMLTTNIFLGAPEANKGMSKDETAGDSSQRYLDFRFRVKKSSMGGGAGFTGSYRGYVQEYKGKSTGDDDEPEVLLEWLENLKLFTKTDTGYDLMGLPFRIQADALKALKNKDLQLMARFPIFYAVFPEAAKTYLDPEMYFYNPFYEAEIVYDAERKFASVRLSKRDRTGKRKKSGKSESPADEKAAPAESLKHPNPDVETARVEGSGIDASEIDLE